MEGRAERCWRRRRCGKIKIKTEKWKCKRRSGGCSRWSGRSKQLVLLLLLRRARIAVRQHARWVTAACREKKHVKATVVRRRENAASRDNRSGDRGGGVWGGAAEPLDCVAEVSNPVRPQVNFKVPVANSGLRKTAEFLLMLNDPSITAVTVVTD